jgi:adenine deaminase
MIDKSAGGLMSERPLAEVAASWQEMRQAAGRLGCRLQEPFMGLSFLALPVIPDLKITDRGLVDVGRFEPVALFV